jgi:hypothetical protein
MIRSRDIVEADDGCSQIVSEVDCSVTNHLNSPQMIIYSTSLLAMRPGLPH